jgi:drug/metabolite transporter (DMT)-like permease
MSENKVCLLMVFTALFWSGAFITGKMAVVEFPPFALTFFRFLFALPFIFCLLYGREKEKWLPKGKQWIPLIILGIVGTFFYHVLFFSALRYTTAINSSLIGATNPVLTTLMAVLFFNESLTKKRLIGIIFSFSGVFLIVTNADWQLISTFSFNPGDVLMFIAVLSWALYALLSRSYMLKYSLSPLMVTSYTFLICVLISIPFVIGENPATYLHKTSVYGWLSILYMSLFASVLGYLIQLFAIEKIGASRAAVFVNLVPIFTIIQSVFILGESFTLFKCIGALSIIIGVYLATRSNMQVSENSCGTRILKGKDF